MTDILELEDAWALLRRLYRKKKEGWTAISGLTDNGLLSFLFKGPDDVIEIVQDNHLTFLGGDMSRLPRPWRPSGKGVVLDEDITKLPPLPMPGKYGVRPISQKMFKEMMRISMMTDMEAPMGEIAYRMNRAIEEHMQQPLVSYNQIHKRKGRGNNPRFTTGMYTFFPSLIDISPEQRKLEARLDAEVRRMQRKRHPYIA